MMKKRFTLLLSIMILSSLLIAACRVIGGNNEPNPTEINPNPKTTPTHAISATVEPHRLATPASQQPAAGICGAAEGNIVTVRINPDVPDPRCVIITSDQRLNVINNRDEVIQISLGVFEAEIDPGDESLAPLTFGEYLAPGVHLIEVSPCCGASLWLQE
jgi:hypothetical protein